MICPDYGSFARRALGRAWAYFEPGEHLSIPTREGALACVRRAATELGLRPEQYRACERRALSRRKFAIRVLDRGWQPPV